MFNGRTYSQYSQTIDAGALRRLYIFSGINWRVSRYGLRPGIQEVRTETGRCAVIGEEPVPD